MLEFLDERLYVNGLVTERVQSGEDCFKLLPAVSVEDTFAVDHLLERIGQVF